MEITMGWILVGTSTAGIVASLAGLLAAGKVFAKQRERLLEKIETE